MRIQIRFPKWCDHADPDQQHCAHTPFFSPSKDVYSYVLYLSLYLMHVPCTLYVSRWNLPIICRYHLLPKIGLHPNTSQILGCTTVILYVVNTWICVYISLRCLSMYKCRVLIVKCTNTFKIYLPLSHINPSDDFFIAWTLRKTNFVSENLRNSVNHTSYISF